jgi:hypothetical protein
MTDQTAPMGWRVWKLQKTGAWMSPKEWAFPDVEEAKKLAEDLKVRPSSKEIVIMPNEAEPKPPIKAPVKVDFAAMRAKWGDFGGPATTYALFGYGGIIKQTHALSNQMMAFFSERAAGAAAVRHLAGKGVDVSKMFSPNVWPVTAMTPGDDALIDRTRATVAKQFLESDNEVLLMIDHDIEWVNASHETGYEGDPLHLCRLAAETRGTVGAIISKKVIGQGIASMFGDAITTPIGQDGAFSSPVVGSGMTAYHRDVVEDVWETMLKWECLGRIPAPGYVPIFMPNLALHPNAPGDLIVNSEDWAFCERGRRLGYVSYLATRPKTGHWGQYKYEVDKDAAPQQPVAAPAPVPPSGQGLEPAAVPRGDHGGGAVDLSEIKISLLHATRGRPEMALAAHDKWVEMASGEVTLEYIFSIDDDDPLSGVGKGANQHDTHGKPSRVAVPRAPDHGPVVIDVLWESIVAKNAQLIHGDNRGNVDAYNRAAWASTGQVLVQVHDDVTPPQNWDLLILDQIKDVNRPALLHVNDGTPPEVNLEKKGWLPTIAILTRAFAEKVGGMWNPGYISLFCDDDLGQKAIQDGVFLDAPDIVFKHDWQGADRDETQKRSYAQANWEHGERLFLTRKAAGFPDGVWGEVVK